MDEPPLALAALHWYDHAVLLEITVAQIFLYTSEQLAATLNLAALLLLWTLIRWAIHYESAQQATRPPVTMNSPTRTNLSGQRQLPVTLDMDTRT